ncbi:MAG TPA: TIR domain-containing protein [Chthoniobacterales bacterium]|nr:TIR domain-containing protein [Chthoniobacterales bacterium]
MAHDVFVSHSAKDKTVSDALVARLEAEGIRCWVAPRDVVPGADWGESIIDAIESSRIMVLIFSASANGSPQIKREIERAVDKGVYTIPFRIEDVQPTKALEYFISTAHWLDAFSQPLGQHLDSLARTLKAILSTPRAGSTEEIVPPRPVMVPPPPPSLPIPPSQTYSAPQSRPSPAPAAPQRPGKTNWTLIIVGILALLLIAGVAITGVVFYLLRASPTTSHVSSSPAPSRLSPPSKLTAPPSGPEAKLKSAGENTDGIPPEKALKKLALDTLLLFNEAVQARNFKAFHASLGTAWKRETTPRKLQEIFHEFVDQNIDFAEIADVDPTLDGSPAIDNNGWLVFKGRYNLPAQDVFFEVKYENEEASWKLVGLNVRTKPHAR